MTEATVDGQVAEVRAFNRFYTRVIGVLGARMHDTAYSLTEARVLYELGTRAEMETGELRRLLDLDAGHLSRMLARFEAGGLLARERSAADGRRHVLRLTPAGRAELDTLNAASASAVGALLDPLGAAERRRLATAMAAIRQVLGDAPRPASGTPYVIRPPRPGDLGWIVHRHGVLYAEEYGWDHTFEGLVARIAADFAEGHDPRREALWIAEVDGRPAGSVCCARGDDDRTAKLRLLLVEPSARGMGIGGRLVDECVEFARRAGYRRMVLLTVADLAAARRIYRRAGFRLEESEPGVPWGGTTVTNETWSRDL
ncbi:MarR family transcriptional regulator [Sphaerisporangium rufum]|uniref:MarR family transcriptional regulator n=1 Tax=Sphaerisporangium rufum TaxID=1381558 RepID=A0A919UZA8_9ACTN|nr:MarR family transcriptional regulator [Sphaerisporangium rufum]